MPFSPLTLYVQICRRLGLPPDKMLYLFSDILCLMGSALLAIGLRTLLGDYIIPWQSFSSLCLLFLFSPLVAIVLGLYTTSLLQPPHQVLYRLFCFVSAVYGILFMIFFFSQTGALHSRMVFFVGWVLACFAVPLGRLLVTRLFCHRVWWGYPIVFFSRTATGKKLWHYLRKNPGLGFRPVAFYEFADQSEAQTARELKTIVEHFPGAVALIAQRAGTVDKGFFSLVTASFSRILVIPLNEEDDAVRSFLVTPYVLDTTTGFFLQQRLHDKRRLAIKRALDLLLCLLGSVVVIPFGLLLALLIRLDSKGPVFYKQRRIGMGGRPIEVHKFRTMVQDADTVLKEYLAANPQLADEWKRDHKLRHDPRITRIGHFLRHSSLDELPQLYDVVRGTMSLVGPRPIVEAEREKYGDVFNEYIRVRPGISGLWQISGRNDTTYDKRVSYDYYYVSNWSVWLDIWILVKTIPVVLFGKGAY